MPGLVDSISRLLSFRINVGVLAGLGLLLGVPYLMLGLIWSLTHTARLHELQGLDLVVSFFGSVLWWPVLVIASVCLQ
ncbi:hypothetical protein [Mycobacterium sp. UM_Kg1]|uniref:hypothetical protein n=1 Tax=Mycobacterium sp. UM_Kg1 TaxID=1545691 RepID=UPI00061AE688|nr:hypothetical protein [Mycobacterium sp. UM_Kg1]